MRVSPRTALWPQLVAISLIGLGVAGCADTTRFGDLFGSTGSTNTSASRNDAYSPTAQSASAAPIEAKPLPHLASAEQGLPGSGAPPRSHTSPQAHSAPASPKVASAPRGRLVAPAVVHVVSKGVGCSGTLITNHLVLTAHHCVVERSSEGEILEGTLTCTKCGERYPIEDGIPNMLPPDQRS